MRERETVAHRSPHAVPGPPPVPTGVAPLLGSAPASPRSGPALRTVASGPTSGWTRVAAPGLPPSTRSVAPPRSSSTTTASQ